MLTEELINREFISSVVSSGIGRANLLMKAAISENISGEVAQYQIGILDADRMEQDGHGRFEMTVGLGLRLLDIRYSKHYRQRTTLYNRAIWPILYGRVLPKLRYGLTEDMRKRISAQLSAGKEVGRG